MTAAANKGRDGEQKRTAGAKVLGDPPGLSVLLWQFIERVFGFQLTASKAKHVAFLNLNARLCFNTRGIPLPGDLAGVSSAAVTQDRQALLV